jgi:hypothetical protein
MSKELPVQFIREKIQELQTAVVFPETNAIVKVPNYVISAVQTDELGNIWFTIRRPALYMEQDEWQFPCRMDFFKKGIGYHMKVYGNASIISNFDEVSCPGMPASLQQHMEEKLEVVIKVALRYADYFELQPLKPENQVEENGLPFGNWLHKLLHLPSGQRAVKENIRLEFVS